MQRPAVSHRPNTSDPYQSPVLALVRNRRFCEDPINQGNAADGTRMVWYKVDLKDAVGLKEKGRTILEAVEACFRQDGLQPEAHVLIGASDKRLTLAFSFPPEQTEKVNQAVTKINAASRNLQQARSAAQAI